MGADFILDTVFGVAALLATFEGARRVVGLGPARPGITILVVGLALCAIKAGIAFYTASVGSSLVEAERDRRIAPLAQDWGATMSPAEREKSSRAYAAAAFVSTGKMLDYFDQSGRTIRFVPSNAQVRDRANSVVFTQLLESTARDERREGYRWTLSGVLAFVAGIATGRRKCAVPRKKPSNRVSALGR